MIHVKKIMYGHLQQQLKITRQEWADAYDQYLLSEQRRTSELAQRSKQIEDLRKRIDKIGRTIRSRVGELEMKKITATKDEFWMVRLNAVAGLGKIKGRASLEAVLRLTKDEHPRVREVSISYLGQFKSPRVIPSLKAQLNDDEGVRKKAKEWLDHLEMKKSKSKKK